MTHPSTTQDQQCIAFLQWALPRLQMRWPGFRKVRGQVCKCIRRRMAELDLDGYEAYRLYLQDHPGEWETLDGCCRITISHFYRDRGVFERLRREVLPVLIRLARREERPLRAWSAGCASGEEPYTLALILHYDFGDCPADILATDIDRHLLARARRACYPAGSLKELPAAWREEAFVFRNEEHCLLPEFQRAVRFRQQDVRQSMPEGPFDLVFCRNLVAMYFAEDLQRSLFRKIAGRMIPQGWLVLGAHESLPSGLTDFQPHPREALLFRKQATAPPGKC